MTPRVGSLPDGSRGFDLNGPITAVMAQNFVAYGYAFAMRYVRRKTKRDYDLSVAEVLTILNAGLALGIVQHVAAEGWTPKASLGIEYGGVAAAECKLLGIPDGVTVWCDLEGINIATPEQEVIEYCNMWYHEVHAAGYHPGLYVGWHAGLDAQPLYRKTKFKSYWSAYNLDRDKYPAVRGVQMRQFVAKPLDRIPGITVDFDVNIIHTDALGGTPTLLLPD